jgi:hypothetical protein
MKRILSLIGVVLVVGSLYWFSPIPDGPYELYHENGEIREKGTYKDDEKCGEWLEEGETVTYDPC